jgi:hypothetical protein
MVKDEKGQALLEFALVLPLLLILIVGIFDLGRVLYSFMHLNIISQETVRLGGLGKSNEEMSQNARNMLHIGDPSNLDINITPTERRSGEYVKVTLQYPVEYMTPFISNVLPSPFMIITDSTIRVE